jgi:hypothetical protein
MMRMGISPRLSAFGRGLAGERLAEALDQNLRHFLGPAAWQVGQLERAIGRAQQARDLKPQMFEHAADFAVLAFGQRHFDPLVAPGAALHVGVDIAIAHAVDLDAFDQVFELALRDVAKGARAIGARDAGGGQFKRALQLAIVGEQQQALGVEVEAAHGHHARRIAGQGIAQGVVDRRATGGIALGGDQAGGLVEAEDARGRGRRDQLAIDAHAPEVLQDRGGGLDQHAVEAHAALGDQALDLAARGDPGAGEQLGDAFAFAFTGIGAVVARLGRNLGRALAEGFGIGLGHRAAEGLNRGGPARAAIGAQGATARAFVRRGVFRARTGLAASFIGLTGERLLAKGLPSRSSRAGRSVRGPRSSRRSAKRSPRGARSSRRSAKRSPRGARSSRRSAKRSPRGARSSRRSAKRSPRGARSSRRSAKRSPRGARSSRRSAKRSPRGARPSWAGRSPSAVREAGRGLNLPLMGAPLRSSAVRGADLSSGRRGLVALFDLALSDAAGRPGRPLLPLGEVSSLAHTRLPLLRQRTPKHVISRQKSPFRHSREGGNPVFWGHIQAAASGFPPSRE